MSNPFLGEIRMVGFNFAPRGWALCNGQTMNISQNAALFALLGTTYGGNGSTTFALPDMRSRVPIHQGTGNGLSAYVMGEMSGTETTSLNVNNLPSHSHPLTEAAAKMIHGVSSNPGTLSSPAGNILAVASAGTPYAPPPANTIMSPTTFVFGNGAATGLTGSSTPVSKIQPFLCVNFIIALQGIFPSRN